GRVAVHLEDERLLALLEQRRLLGQERAADDFVDVLHRAAPWPAPRNCGVSLSSSLSSASWLTTRCLQSITSYAVRWVLATTRTPSRLRPDSTRYSLGSWSTTTALPATPIFPSNDFSSLVLGSPTSNASI